MKLYNLIFEGTILNKKPLCFEKAEQQQNNCIFNYGYRPQIVEA